MGWLSTIGEIFKTIGVALGWAKREEEKQDDFKIAKAADLTGVVQEQQDAQKIGEAVGRLSDDELNRRLRLSQSGG